MKPSKKKWRSYKKKCVLIKSYRAWIFSRTNCWDMRSVEAVVGPLENEAGLANSVVADDHQFDGVVVAMSRNLGRIRELRVIRLLRPPEHRWCGGGGRERRGGRGSWRGKARRRWIPSQSLDSFSETKMRVTFFYLFYLFLWRMFLISVFFSSDSFVVGISEVWVFGH